MKNERRREDLRFMRKETVIPVVILLLIAVLSFTLAGPAASRPSTYRSTSAVLDEKEENVLKLAAAATTTSALLSMIPGDAATPIAEKMADFSTYFMWVLCAIFLEKYLLTILGFAAFRILIPAACILGVTGFLLRNGSMKSIGVKLAMFGLVMWMVIPISVSASGMIEKTYEDSIQETLDAAADAQSELEEAANASSPEEQTEEDTSPGDDRNILEKAEEWISDTAGNLADTASEITEGFTGGEIIRKANDMVNDFVEAIAVMIVTSCLIPVLVLLFMFWVIKLLFGMSFPSLNHGGRA